MTPKNPKPHFESRSPATGRTRPGVVAEGDWKRVESVAEDFVAKTAKSKLKAEVKPDDASARLILLYLDGKRNSWK